MAGQSKLLRRHRWWLEFLIVIAQCLEMLLHGIEARSGMARSCCEAHSRSGRWQ